MLRLLTLSALVASSAAHFLLHYPATIGFDDDLEGTAPCGSFTPKFSSGNVTDFHVAGDSIALTSTHPAAVWLFRATLGTDDTATNWTNLLPVVSQTDLGNFCETNLTVPDSWVGQQGLVQVIQDAADGMLFQCAAVNFVAGTIAPPSVCNNVTGLTASFTADPALSSIPATATPTASRSGSASMSMTSGSAASASATKASDASSLSVISGPFGSLAPLFVLIASASLMASFL